jgi:hypothetical protein
MSIHRKPILAVLLGTAAVGLSSPAFADGSWNWNHPRRAEVNRRIDHQERMIRHDVRDGQLSHAQGRAMMQQERGVRAEERADARLDRGHITRGEQAQLNGDLNAIHHEIPR